MQISTSEIYVAKFGVSEIGPLQICLGKIEAVEVFTSEVYTTEIWLLSSILPPLVPRYYPLLKQGEMFFVCHVPISTPKTSVVIQEN
ncbi:hypothetical protein H6F94_24130 [Leptolyngbya sp. FACHB-261]|nr:hypothetical protein [Leptolyngbya sp. FACHB-261]MBD2103952.1 hypothetical protein [Leptolyngbya sp. FACHB-261]